MSSFYRAIGKSMLSRYAVYACNMLSLMVLTRLFKPEVFGIVAAVQTIVTLLQLVAEGGLSPAIINLHGLEPEDRNGIFGLSILAAALISMMMLICSPILAEFYKIPEVRLIVPFMAITLFANTAVVLPLALLQRQQFFKKIAQAGIVAEICALGVVLFCHILIAPLYAYVLYFPAKAIVNFLMHWYYSGKTEFGLPVPGSKFSAIRPLLGTTGYQLGFNFVNYFSRNLDNILVGRYIGPVSLGIYDRSYQLMRYPLMLLTFAMTPAIQPSLRNLKHDVAAVNELHRDLAFKLSVVGSLAAICVFFFAKYIVLLAFGQNWIAVVPVIKLLALIIPVQTILSTSGSFFQAFNRTDLMFVCGLFSAFVNIIAIIWGVSLGSLSALCWALTISFHINFLQAYYVLHKYVFAGGFVKFMASMWPFILTASGLAFFSLAA